MDGGLDTDPGHCVDLQVGWRDGWIELRADPFVHHALLAPAEDRRALVHELLPPLR